MSARLQAVAVPEGSVVLLSGVELPDEHAVGDAHQAISAAVGHERFCLVISDQGAVEVWGPDVDLAAKVRELLDQGQEP